jgi:hypothetical protein
MLFQVHGFSGSLAGFWQVKITISNNFILHASFGGVVRKIEAGLSRIMGCNRWVDNGSVLPNHDAEFKAPRPAI